MAWEREKQYFALLTQAMVSEEEWTFYYLAGKFHCNGRTFARNFWLRCAWQLTLFFFILQHEFCVDFCTGNCEIMVFSLVLQLYIYHGVSFFFFSFFLLQESETSCKTHIKISLTVASVLQNKNPVSSSFRCHGQEREFVLLKNS